ncbi:MAG: HIT domain-containing protein [Saprospiraceae bacterium]|nr:HIT domain-containing protein [Saprospiraceae bacterium]
MPSIFSRIVAGEIPCHKIAETADYLAFLDIQPRTEGHTLVIPKQEINYIFDIADEPLAGMMIFAKKVARAVQSCVPCERIGVAVIGLEVPHAHIHLVPINTIGDLSFERAPLSFPSEEMAVLAARIGEAYHQL